MTSELDEQDGSDVKVVPMCLECGADERDSPGVTVTESPPEDPDAGSDLRPQLTCELSCAACGNEETVRTGTLPAQTADSFGLTEAPVGESMPVEIWSGTSDHDVHVATLEYKGIEEYVTETTLYDRGGVNAHGRMHQVRIVAFEPPTLTQGNAYRVRIGEDGEYLDQRMLLTGIRYMDEWRRLSFSRKLDGGIIDQIENDEHLRDRQTPPTPDGSDGL